MKTLVIVCLSLISTVSMASDSQQNPAPQNPNTLTTLRTTGSEKDGTLEISGTILMKNQTAKKMWDAMSKASLQNDATKRAGRGITCINNAGGKPGAYRCFVFFDGQTGDVDTESY